MPTLVASLSLSSSSSSSSFRLRHLSSPRKKDKEREKTGEKKKRILGTCESSWSAVGVCERCSGKKNLTFVICWSIAHCTTSSPFFSRSFLGKAVWKNNLRPYRWSVYCCDKRFLLCLSSPPPPSSSLQPLSLLSSTSLRHESTRIFGSLCGLTLYVLFFFNPVELQK